VTSPPIRQYADPRPQPTAFSRTKDDDEHEDESSISEFRFNPKAEDKR
jgi:hypothetical protein